MYASGTLGDSYFIILKALYYDYKLITHITRHVHLFESINEIYSLKKDLKVNFQKFDSKKHKGINRIVGHIDNKHDIVKFPTFDLPDVKKFGLPKKYIVLQIQSGSNQNNLKNLNKKNFKLLKDKKNIVLIGIDNLDIKDITPLKDLRGKTKILEALSIIKNSNGFYGPQGIMSFFAISQKIPTKIFIKNKSDVTACKNRIEKVPEWKEYFKYC